MTLTRSRKIQYAFSFPLVLVTLTHFYEHQYDLRAVLMSDGIPGRDHTYAYLRGYDGKWYKSLDAMVTEVGPLSWSVEVAELSRFVRFLKKLC